MFGPIRPAHNLFVSCCQIGDRLAWASPDDGCIGIVTPDFLAVEIDLNDRCARRWDLVIVGWLIASVAADIDYQVGFEYQ